MNTSIENGYNASNNFADTSVSVTIAPKYSNSLLLIDVTLAGIFRAPTAGGYSNWRVMLNGNPSGSGQPIGGPWPMAYALGYETTGDTYTGHSAHNHWVDGPYNTTGNLTYTVQVVVINGGTTQLNRDGGSRSGITIMEIKQ
jgi:hypothetical protein